MGGLVGLLTVREHKHQDPVRLTRPLTVWHLGRLKEGNVCCCHRWCVSCVSPAGQRLLVCPARCQLVTSIMVMSTGWGSHCDTDRPVLPPSRTLGPAVGWQSDKQRQCAPCLKLSDSPFPLNWTIVPPLTAHSLQTRVASYILELGLVRVWNSLWWKCVWLTVQSKSKLIVAATVVKRVI